MPECSHGSGFLPWASSGARRDDLRSDDVAAALCSHVARPGSPHQVASP